MKYTIIGAVVGPSLVLLGAYIAGFNFDERGANAFGVYVFTILATLVGAAVGASEDLMR